ncbi:MAG: hypothetical protein Q8M94_22830 [Ignavibacteria bacterium]|nr:hypothetical protein [Ignavibacteria bacterium]
MLSDNFKRKLTTLLIFIFIVSCSDRKEKIPAIEYGNKNQVLEVVKKHFNKDVDIAFGGMFDETGKQLIAIGREINNSDDWGIKFAFIEKSEDEFELKYETDLLEGSLKECFVDKIKFASIDYDLVYFNSQGYFLGSGGGEVFSYIVDLENKQVYYAHLVIESEISPSLFISDNTNNKELINFFTMTFKKDYPGLKLVDDDIVVE